MLELLPLTHPVFYTSALSLPRRSFYCLSSEPITNLIQLSYGGYRITPVHKRTSPVRLPQAVLAPILPTVEEKPRKRVAFTGGKSPILQTSTPLRVVVHSFPSNDPSYDLDLVLLCSARFISTCIVPHWPTALPALPALVL